MAKRRNLAAVLANLPRVHQGRRGVSAELAELQRYMRANGLFFAPGDAVSAAICQAVGYSWECKTYIPGGIKRRASYTNGRATGRAEFDAAQASAPAGLRSDHGLLVTTGDKPRERFEWRYNGRRWVRVRAWVVEVRAVGANIWRTGARVRCGRWSVQRCRVGGRDGWEVVEYAGRAADSLARRVAGRLVLHVSSTAAALREYISRVAVGPVPGRVGSGGGGPVNITARLLRRLCPAGWSVVESPASAGEAPSPAFREVDTGEEYHFPARYSGRAPVREASVAFERRAQAREQTALMAVVERGDAAGVAVCLADSLRAGNCRAGSLSFAGRHGLDPSRHYSAGELLAQSNGDARFVRAAVLAALRRERREQAAGFCVLADHRA